MTSYLGHAISNENRNLMLLLDRARTADIRWSTENSRRRHVFGHPRSEAVNSLRHSHTLAGRQRGGILKTVEMEYSGTDPGCENVRTDHTVDHFIEVIGKS